MQSILRTQRSVNSHYVSNKITSARRGVSPSLRMTTINPSQSALIADWKQSAAILPFIQRRHYSNKSTGTDVVSQHDIAYFKNKSFSNEQITQVKRTTKGGSFRVIPLPAGSEHILKATEIFIHTF